MSAARIARELPRQARFGFGSEAAIEQAQRRRIAAAVAYAKARVPYYRETMRRLLIGSEELRSAEDLARLPLIERADLQRDPEYFVSTELPLDSLLELRSGGTTGAPLSIFRDGQTVLAQAVHYERLRTVVARLAGRRFRYREVLIGPPHGSTARTINAARAVNPLPRNLRVDLHALDLRPPEQVIPELNRLRPDAITAYGSYLEELFTYLRELSPPFAAPRVAIFGADALADSAREWARTFLGMEILGNYGAVEAPHVGFECEAHRGYHLNVDLYPVRLLGADGAEPTGEVVVSNLVNRGTVLLNYRLGDVLTMVNEPCACGRTLPLCSYLERTKVAYLPMPDGQRLHAQVLRLVLHRDKAIRRFQLIQKSERLLQLRVVPAPDADREATAGRLVSELRARLPAAVDVQVEFVATLPRDPSGKVASIVPLAR